MIAADQGSLDFGAGANYAGTMHYVAPLMAEAWEQHHRRRARLSLAAVASVFVAALAWWALDGPGRTAGGGASASSVSVRPSVVLARSPYMGIADCHPRLSVCYRVGLAVWLKRPAQSVTAKSAGVTLSLDRTDNGRGIEMISFARRREFIGFFKPGGIVPHAYLRTPDATDTPVAVVSLTINMGRGRSFVTRLRVPVEAGWG